MNDRLNHALVVVTAFSILAFSIPVVAFVLYLGILTTAEIFHAIANIHF